MIARNPKNGLMLNQQKRVIISEKNRKQRNSTENWTLFYANVRGITSKRLGLMEILGEVKPQIALFTETMLKNGSSFQHGQLHILWERKGEEVVRWSRYPHQ